MAQMTAGEAIVRTIRAHGVDTLFGLPGAQMYPLFDALAGHSNEIRTIGCRHEQGAAYMAFGYAKSIGRPGVYSVVPGPGVLNTTAALCTAAGCNAPVMCLTGQVPSAFLGRGRGHLHELPDQLATLRSLIKWAEFIEQPADAPALVHNAFREMQSHRPGPVSLEICWDTLGQSAEFDPSEFSTGHNIAKPPLNWDSIEHAAGKIAEAKNPMIMVGGGAQHASGEIRQLAELLGAPVTAFRSGRGIVSEDHPLGLSNAAAYELWPDTDLLLGIGTRLELPYMRWAHMMQLIDKPEAPPYLIRLDIDAEEMQRLRPHQAIIADAVDGVQALVQVLSEYKDLAHGSPDQLTDAKTAARAKYETVQPQVGYLDVIRRVLPRDGFFVEELCQVGFASYFAFPVYQPRTYVTPGFQGTLGFGLPTVLGVKVANPDKAVVSIIGDGGFGFAIQELATAAAENIAVVTILFNNNAYGNVRRDQQERFGGRLIGADLGGPDYLKIIEGFGVAAYRANNAKELEPVLTNALADNKPAVIEVPLEKDSETSPWPFIHPNM